MRASLLPAALLSTVTGLAACAGPGYYYQAMSGQLALMRSRQEVQAYLDGAPDGDPLAARLHTARDVLRFAAGTLDLPADDSYSSFAITGREAVVWNVVAAPEFSLQPRRWCFLVAGCVPYRGYFHRADAQRLADKLAGKGLDVAVAGATAYSTLGWFKDPIPDTVLNLPDARLAATLIHELAHRKLYVRGDTEFSESYAAFVEAEGVARWLQARGQPDQERIWRDYLRASEGFDSLLEQTRDELAAVYSSGLPPDAMRDAKRAAFASLAQRYRASLQGPEGGRDWFGGWFDDQPNNADLALMSAYSGGQCAFRALFREAGGDFAAFHRLARAASRNGAEARHAWLQQPC